MKKIHFIGIGGVGMSGIALVAAKRGFQVSGSDMKETRTTTKLRQEQIEIFIGQRAENISEDIDIVVISSAIPDKNPELMRAKELGIDIWHRSEMLAELGVGKKTLACAGTHGKTTSSSMLATTIDRMGLDPSFLIGGTVDGYDSNAKNGEGDFYIVEADESDGSFVHLSPYVALITNIEPDHLDHYGSLEAIYDAFGDFLDLLPEKGAACICAEDENLLELAKKHATRAISYGEVGNTLADVTFEITGRAGIGHKFHVSFPDGQNVDLAIKHNPGRHNVLNATGVLTVIWALGLDLQAAKEALETFSGVRRRFDLIGEVSNICVVDDYAHHPTEIKATLKAARELDFKHVHVLFQPHRYSRTQALAAEFASSFVDADSVTIMDVYSAGEAPIPGVNGKTLVQSILKSNPRSQLAWISHRKDVLPYLSSKLVPGDLIITMGAGDVTSLAPQIVDMLK